jgi:hypothetical protein
MKDSLTFLCRTLGKEVKVRVGRLLRSLTSQLLSHRAPSDNGRFMEQKPSRQAVAFDLLSVQHLYFLGSCSISLTHVSLAGI